MTAIDLKIALCEIENGRYEDIIHVLDIRSECSQCDHFNLSINDKRRGYRCKVWPKCIAATLSPELILYFNRKLGWIEADK